MIKIEVDKILTFAKIIRRNNFKYLCKCYGEKCLKSVDTNGNCQRLAVSVSQYMREITNLWKFELNRSSKLGDNNERKKHPCHTKLCAFRWLISRPQVLNLRSRNQIRGKSLLSRKLWHFSGSRFSQCFIPSTSPHYSSPRKVLC